MTISDNVVSERTFVSRDTVHDLRNLFGIISSAVHLLERERSPMPTAISGAAERGARLVTSLLLPKSPIAVEVVDLNLRIRNLESMILAIIGPRMELQVDLHSDPLPVTVDPADLDSAVLELATNAHSASQRARKLVIRSRKSRGLAWITVGDNGGGMSYATLLRCRNGRSSQAGRGTGIRRVRRFAQDAGGRLSINSRMGSGTAVTMSLPIATRPDLDGAASNQWAFGDENAMMMGDRLSRDNDIVEIETGPLGRYARSQGFR